MDQYHHPYIIREVYIPTTLITMKLKKHFQVLHKLHPKYSQGELEKLSVLKFSLVEIETFSPVSFVLCTDTEMLQIQNIGYMKKVQMKKIFSTLGLVINQMLINLVLKPICGNNMTLKPSSLLMIS